MYFARWGDQKCTAYSKWGLTKLMYWDKKILYFLIKISIYRTQHSIKFGSTSIIFTMLVEFLIWCNFNILCIQVSHLSSRIHNFGFLPLFLLLSSFQGLATSMFFFSNYFCLPLASTLLMWEKKFENMAFIYVKRHFPPFRPWLWLLNIRFLYHLQIQRWSN